MPEQLRGMDALSLGGMQLTARAFADGAVDLHFQYLKAPFDGKARRLELIRRLNSIPSVSIPEEYASKTRTLLLSALSSDEALDDFIRTMQWYEDEVKRSESMAVF
jgi:hypothetical protein